jgi:hypothetical protein
MVANTNDKIIFPTFNPKKRLTDCLELRTFLFESVIQMMPTSYKKKNAIAISAQIYGFISVKRWGLKKDKPTFNRAFITTK